MRELFNPRPDEKGVHIVGVTRDCKFRISYSEPGGIYHIYKERCVAKCLFNHPILTGKIDEIKYIFCK